MGTVLFGRKDHRLGLLKKYCCLVSQRLRHKYIKYWFMICFISPKNICYRLSPSWVIISSYKDFSLEVCFYIWFFISSHSWNKLFKNNKICLKNKFFSIRNSFFTSYKHQFFTFCYISKPSGASYKIIQNFGKYGAFVDVRAYQRPPHLF